MSKRATAAYLAVLLVLGAAAPAQGKQLKGYLDVYYYWQINLGAFKCGPDQVYTLVAPFTIRGNKIVGDLDLANDDLEVEPLVPDPTFPKQSIAFSWACGACRTKGRLVINRVRGRVVRVKGKKMLHFYVKYSITDCLVDCPGEIQDIDCSRTAWDEFMAPMEDGYIVERPENAILKYSVNFLSK